METKSGERVNVNVCLTKKVSSELLKIENPKVSPNQHLINLFTNSNTRDKSKFMAGIDHSNSVLNRVRNFLPIIKQANDDVKVAVENGENVDIETVDENESKELIEMNLALFNDSDSSSDVDDDDYSLKKEICILGNNRQKSSSLISEFKDESND